MRNVLLELIVTKKLRLDIQETADTDWLRKFIISPLSTQLKYIHVQIVQITCKSNAFHASFCACNFLIILYTL